MRGISIHVFVGGSSLTHDRVLAGAEELQDLKGVWTELGKIWQKIDEMKEKPWITIAPRKIRHELEALIEQMKLMPNNLKTYSSYDYVLKLIRGYLKVIVFIRTHVCKYIHYINLFNLILLCALYMYEYKCKHAYMYVHTYAWFES